MNITVPFGLSFLVFIGGCDPQTQIPANSEGAAADGDQPGRVADWSAVELVDELWNIGSLEGPEHQVLGRVAGATFAGARLALSDGHSNRIHWYDSSGHHEVSAGGGGGGPGEFRAIHSLAGLLDGSLAALDLGGALELFSRSGDPMETLLFPGSAREMCLADSTIVVLGARVDFDGALHLATLAQPSWSSIGTTGAPPSDTRHRLAFALGYLDGSVGCRTNQIIYARSSDATVRAYGLDGSVHWQAEVPYFVSMVHEDAGERGIRHAPPDGATEVHAFTRVVGVGQYIAVQALRRDLDTNEISLSTVFLDGASGRVLGKDDTLPLILAASDNRLAVLTEDPVPRVTVYAVRYR